MSYFDSDRDVGVLMGQTITKLDHSDDEVVFTTKEGNRYKMYHVDD